MRPKILHVIGGLDLGGAETLLYRVATTHSDRFDHEVVCLGEEGWFSEPLRERGVTVHHLGIASMSDVAGGFRRLRSLIAECRPALIQSWMYLANMWAGLAARKSGIPVVWTIHASTFEHLGLPSRICAYVGGRTVRPLASAVVNCSAKSARQHARFGYAAVPNVVIHNGYDSHVFHPDDGLRPEMRAALDLRPDSFVIGSVSRWHSEKDVASLVDAIGHLRRRHPTMQCVLIGPGLDDANPDLVAALDRNGVEGMVVALGSRKDIPDLMRAMDLHVLPSRSEAFPNVVAESMLTAIPNVVTDVGDSAQIVGDTGWVVPPADSARLAEAFEAAIREWEDDRPTWNERSRSARNRVQEHFTAERMIASYEALWIDLTTARR